MKSQIDSTVDQSWLGFIALAMAKVKCELTRWSACIHEQSLRCHLPYTPSTARNIMATSREKEEKLRVKTVVLCKIRGCALAITVKASVVGKLEDVVVGTVHNIANNSPLVVAAVRNRHTEKSLLEPTSKTQIQGPGEVCNLDSEFELVVRPVVPRRQVASKGVH